MLTYPARPSKPYNRNWSEMQVRVLP